MLPLPRSGLRAATCLLWLLSAGCGDDAHPAVDGGVDARAPADMQPGFFGDGPPATVYPHVDWVDFCINFTACGYWGASLTDCISKEPRLGNLPYQSDEGLVCIRKAGSDCAAIAACFNAGNSGYQCTYSPADPQRTCAGNTYRFCTNVGIRYALDCKSLGEACVTAGSPGCGFGSCVAGQTPPLCVEGFRTECIVGRLAPVEDCHALQQENCVVANGAASCAGTGAACTADRCNGSTLVKCLGGKQATYACPSRDPGFGCFESAGKAACAFGTSCDATHVDTCAGTVLTYCDAGRVMTIDCAARGFKKCVPSAGPGGGGYCQG